MRFDLERFIRHQTEMTLTTYRKAELQQEVELLRQQMSSATQKVLTADDTLLQSNVEDPGNTSPSFVSNPPPSGQTSENSPLVGPSLCPPILQPGGIEPQTTSPRSLNGSQVEAHKIDDCFSLYPPPIQQADQLHINRKHAGTSQTTPMCYQ